MDMDMLMYDTHLSPPEGVRGRPQGGGQESEAQRVGANEKQH